MQKVINSYKKIEIHKKAEGINSKYWLIVLFTLFWSVAWYLPRTITIFFGPVILTLVFFLAILFPPIALLNTLAIVFYGNTFFTFSGEGNWGKLGAVLMLAGLFIRTRRYRNLRFHLPENYWLFGLLIIFSILSGIYNHSLRNLSLYLNLFLNVALVFLVYNSLRSRFDLDLFSMGMICLGFITIVGAFVTGDRGVRLDDARMALFGGTNSLAFFLAVVLPYCLYFVFSGKRSLTKYWSFIISVFLVLGLLWTGSRGSAIGALIAIITFFFIIKSKMKFVFLVILLAVFVSILIPVDVISETLSRYNNETFEAQNSIQERWRIFDLSSQVFLERPIFGYGPGNGRVQIVKVAPYAFNISGDGKSLHNAYLTAALDLGILGLLVYLSILGNLLASLFSTFDNQIIGEFSEDVPFKALLFSTWGVLVVISFFQSIFYSRIVYLVLAFLLSAVFVQKSSRKIMSTD